MQSGGSRGAPLQRLFFPGRLKPVLLMCQVVVVALAERKYRPSENPRIHPIVRTVWPIMFQQTLSLKITALRPAVSLYVSRMNRELYPLCLCLLGCVLKKPQSASMQGNGFSVDILGRYQPGLGCSGPQSEKAKHGIDDTIANG